ncbi:MAG: FRG domain-containing protein [Flavobacterium sp.]|nr:MAG: FRG domain-containing protein [Flavobacterium sp.]
MTKKTLPTYNNLEEKSKLFRIEYINTEKEFDVFFDTHTISNGIYRGINSSQYKIYTSLQRSIITNDLQSVNYNDYIEKVIQHKNLKKYFENFKIPLSKLSILSYIQHYGGPSPLLDFAYNIKNALYFAVENLPDKHEEKNNINDFFSVFFINQGDIELLEISRVFESLKEQKELGKKIFSGYDDYSDDLLVSHIDKMLDINTLDVFLIDNNLNFTDVYNTYNNIRIISQEGLFINNSHNTRPLEENLRVFFQEATQYQVSPWDDIDTPQAEKINAEYEEQLKINKKYQERLKSNIITSFEINKSLASYIKEKIKINKEDIYPNSEDIIKNIFREITK